MAVGTGQVCAGRAHGIKSLSLVIEGTGQKAKHMLLAEEIVALQGLMNGDMHDIATIELQPAVGAGEFPHINLGRRDACGRWNKSGIGIQVD